MIVKRKLFSFIDEDGNQGYYLYNESTGEEKLFSVVEEEREFARGTGAAVYYAEQMVRRGGQKALNKTAIKKYIESLGKEAREILGISRYLKRNPGTKSDLSTVIGRDRMKSALKDRNYPKVLKAIDNKTAGNIKKNKDAIYDAITVDSSELSADQLKKLYKIR